MGRVLSYSPCHDEFWQVITVPVPGSDEELMHYPFPNNQNLINADRIFQVPSERENGLEENGLQSM